MKFHHHNYYKIKKKYLDFLKSQEELDKASEAGSEESVEMPNPTSVGFMVQKLDTPHLPQDEDSLYKEALRKKAIEEKKSFIKKNQNDNENSN